MTVYYNHFKIKRRRERVRICRAEVSTGPKPVNDRKEKRPCTHISDNKVNFWWTH
jgi:hypothetical protein